MGAAVVDLRKKEIKQLPMLHELSKALGAEEELDLRIPDPSPRALLSCVRVSKAVREWAPCACVVT